MLLGERIRALREAKGLTQGDIQHRSGLVCPYLSRVENGHLVPTLATLERIARALQVPLYQLFYDGEEPPKVRSLPRPSTGENLWGSTRKEARLLLHLCRALARMTPRDRRLLMEIAHRMARQKRP